jgi:phage shock protein PspC (stress-responsive transcriptional regulator)/uncharacterized membrane protein HdeD (DUF308 family)
MLFTVSTTQRPSLNIEDTVKDFVATRPRRARQGRVVAGVAAGIGRRYGIDPVIVRVALVVSAIYGGAGLLAYLLGWLFLVDEDDEVSAFESMINRGRSSTSTTFTVVLCLALIPASNFVFGGHYSTVAGGILLLGGLFLLHRYRADQGRIDPPVTDATRAATPGTFGAASTGGVSDTVPGGVSDAVPSGFADATTSADREAGPMTDAQPTTPFDDPTRARTTPPAWDPLGAAPFAWDLPEPQPTTPPPPPAPARRRKRKTRLAVGTLGVTLILGAVLAAASTNDGWLNPQHVIGILGAVVGVALIVGAFKHSGRALILLAVLFSGIGFAATSTHYDGWHGAGDSVFRPTSLVGVQPLYQRSVGDLTVDLTHLPKAGTVTTHVKLGVGDLTVFVPPDAEVHATCSGTAGSVDCLGQQADGPNTSITGVQNPDATGPHLVVNLVVEDGPGDVEVHGDE